MKKTVAILFVCVFAVAALSGCSKYTSHYFSIGFVHSNGAGSASMSFFEFEGSFNFKLKCRSEDRPVIKYSGKLEAGEITVYYDCGGTKTELFSISSGGDVRSSGGTLPYDTVYIIVETDGNCKNGDFKFEIDYPKYD